LREKAAAKRQGLNADDEKGKRSRVPGRSGREK